MVAPAAETDDDTPMTLDEACRVLFKGNIGPDTLRAEARRGRLTIERIGRRQFVTRAAIREMREKCQERPRVQGSGSSPRDNAPDERTILPSGSFETGTINIARAAALMTLSALSDTSSSTSPKSIGRRSATVIPLKS